MSTVNEARAIIYDAIQAAWDASAGGAPLDRDNEKFDPPVGAPWGRMVVRHQTRAQETLGGVGSRKFQSDGLAIVQCFGPLNEGASAADALAKVVMDALEGGTFTGVRFNSATPTEVGPTDDWYQINVSAAFNYTETK